MTPFQLAALFLTVTTIAVAWARGGHPERMGAAAILIWVTISVATPDWLHSIVLGDVSIFEAALELGLLVVFLGMAMKGRRWWPFAASAVMTLSVMVYLAQFLVADLDRRAEISAHVGLTIALNLTLLVGVFERWLAGEPPASEMVVWNRSRGAS